MIGFTVWLTGLPCAGKSTLATMLSAHLRAAGRHVELLDGDLVRASLSRELGFSKADRDTNVMRIGFVASLLSRHGVACIVAAVSPYREARQRCRALIGDFVEVHVDATVDECVRRDVKGLYKKAMAGELKGVTGIDDPYEPPQHPEIYVDTMTQTPDDSLRRILGRLDELGYIEAGVPPPAAPRPVARG